MKSYHKLTKNCSIHGKNCEIFADELSQMFETETIEPFLVWMLKCGGAMALPGPPSGYAPNSSRILSYYILNLLITLYLFYIDLIIFTKELNFTYSRKELSQALKGHFIIHQYLSVLIPGSYTSIQK